MGKRVALLYGILTGHSVSRAFRSELKRAGHSYVKHADRADIVIAHSAGCFWIPELRAEQTLILVDPPYWPERSIADRVQSRKQSHKRFRDFNISLGRWLARSFWGMFYGIAHFRRTRRIMSFAHQYDLTSVLSHKRTVLVRNEHDDWLTPDLKDLIDNYPHVKLINLAGDHDNIWYQPRPYIALLNEL